MPGPEESREEARRRLHERADALEARTRRKPVAQGEQAVSQAYRIIAELFGGVIVGLALGAGIDWLAGTAPAGLIGGVLLGFGVSVWMAWRTANRLMAQAKAEAGELPSVPFDDEED